MTNKLKIAPSTKFKKDLKKITKQCKYRKLFDHVIEKLQHQEPLQKKHCDHVLIGEYKGYRECHITPDWLLIYRVKNDHSIELLELESVKYSV